MRYTEEVRRENGMSYRIANEEHGEAVTRLLSASFLHEPMGRALGATVEDWARFVSYFNHECMTNGLSVIAVPEQEPGSLAGALISRDFKKPFPPGFPDELPRFAPSIDALVSIDSQYEALRSGLKRGEAMDLWMMGVEPGSRFARHGIASALFQASVDVARHNGFQRCVAECTGHFSQRCAINAGFCEIARVVYKDYRFQGRPVFASIPEPHRTFAIFERVLDPAA
ncbi:hypothetical protein WME77_16190 [Sorangium sp. So ce764]|uniref:hypothetical protein n=1 Tax=Sorangium sp. So ce764 TaxID=3133320 RepID=UPI003F5F6C41